MRILNLYAGIGGNRKLWGDQHEITSVEYKPEIAAVYRHFFPNDTVVEADAHQYLLEHYQEFEFIWSSPPCPSHSKMNTSFNHEAKRHLLRYHDMKLYQEIIFLKHWYKGKWVVENVEPYYKPLIHPQRVIDRHCVWANFAIPHMSSYRPFNVARATEKELAEHFGFDIPAVSPRHRLMLRNIADPEMGLHVLNAAMREIKQETLL